jgi:triosephosphate isomerase (TIM)
LDSKTYFIKIKKQNMRKKIVAGNWKMNLSKQEAIQLFTEINQNEVSGVTLIAFPPALYVHTLADQAKKVSLGFQNFHPAEKGAFTGEISISHVQDSAAQYVLIGHSERRMYFHEDNSFLKEKVDSALNHGITPVFCCGEPLDIREANGQDFYVKQQLEQSIFHLSEEEFSKLVIAYEPIWAIGTGKTASSQQAEAMHKAIRYFIAQRYSEELAQKISILYGGSCNASNAQELFACENVDGGLIGGAALKSSDFLTIANSF